MSKALRSRVPNSALLLLAVAGLASATVACSKEEEKKQAGWTCNASDVPMGEVLRCTQQAATADGPVGGTTSDGTTTTGGAGGTSSDPVSSDGTSGTGTGTGGTGGTDGANGTTDGTSSTGDGTGGSGAVGDLGGSSLSADGTITYECYADNTNPDCPPADAYDGMAGGSGGTGDGSLSSDGTSSTGDGTGGGGGSSTGSGTGGAGGGSTSDGTTTGTGSTGDGSGAGGGGGSSGGSQGTSDGTSSHGNGNGNGNGGANGNGGSNKFPGPDECAWVPDLPYCPSGSGSTSDGSPSMGGGGGTSDGTGGTASSGGTGGSTPGSDKPLPPGQDKKYGGTSDGTSSSGTGSSGGDGATSSSGGSSSGGSSSGGNGNGNGGVGNGNGNGNKSGTTDGSGKGKGRHYVCEKDKKGNKTCTSVPNCVPGTNASNGACADSDSGSGPSGEVLPPALGGCWITGGGFIIAPNDLTGAAADGHDNYGGNAKPMKDGRIQGHWNHVDHGTGNHAKGKPEYIVCRHVDEPGPGQPGGKKGFTMNQAYFGGHAEWRDASTGQWASGYWFDVVVKDHGEPGSVPHAKNGYMVDTYHFTIRKMDDPVAKVSGAVVYEVGRGGNQASGGLVGGNIQLHPPNNGHPYTPMSLPSWVSFEP
jgi:hypothetical protein